MFAGFKLELNPKNQTVLKESLKNDKLTLKSFLETENVKDTLKKFMLRDGSLDAEEMREEWFPVFQCQVFISHSHKDKETAELLAKWLYEKFGIKSFIDSLAWDFCDDLLLEIDKKYCRRDPLSNRYVYKRRNISTAHVHMLLTTALAMMIDKSECLIFLNTPNSVEPKKSIEDESKTYSPWIYGELSISKLLRRRPLDDHRPEERKVVIATEGFEGIPLKYPATLDHLIPIDPDYFLTWSKSSVSNCYEALNLLYQYHKVYDQ
jgi:hypothetical protein